MTGPADGRRQVVEMLAARYGVRAESVEREATGTETRNARVHLAGGARVFVKRYRHDTDTTAVRSALAFAAYCQEAAVPTPGIWCDRDGEPVTWHAEDAWCVIDEVAGHTATTPLTVARAESIGATLGRLHRAAAKYPGPLRRRLTPWRDQSPEPVAATCERLQGHLREQPGPTGDLRSDQLAQRREDLLTHSRLLQKALPDHLAEQALHGDFTRPNILIAHEQVTAVIDFQALSGPAAWELGRIAFDPLTVAHSATWQDTALVTIGAYRDENPGIPAADLIATARVALLYFLFSTFGAVTDDLDVPADVRAGLGAYWNDKNATVSRLLVGLDAMEYALAFLTEPKAGPR
ncbi:phosphotransferase enzyme family protein [Streptomyces sp. H39-C1]|uniref:phosphotransferase enzyme family protein n=1 Tax=Streptomyces sp. H39-C1 TaxID=3004355 RepID=UPI0022B04E85|nr:phosphotransferase [Streptomyces sp. H39-C1]MCZ4100753.1 phosphotransferase [Streptomyces sp. H39-C1]